MTFTNARLILPDRITELTTLTTHDGRIQSIGKTPSLTLPAPINLGGKYLAPGFIDIHVHGGAGADFMDLTPEAFRTVCQCHARHGTTTLTPTSTVATHAQYKQFLQLCQQLRNTDTGGARIAGGHLYGPYFHPPAKGCHPTADFLTPQPEQDDELLAFAGTGLVTLTVAPETPGTQRLVEAARAKGVLVTAGHTFATFQQMEEAIRWGVRHVDHLFCAMSDRARLRQSQAFPMRAGVMEATLVHDELTTEVIADGWHLSRELLLTAYRIKGPDKLALVSDAMRAVDMPDGEYRFGSNEVGERIRRRGEVGVTLDGSGLASGVMALDHGIRTFHKLTGAPLHEVIRMATLTPARILGLADVGQLAVGCRADMVVLNESLDVVQVYVGGAEV
jgi:N-acetylglucosamine-6-phosphate deacetylase